MEKEIIMAKVLDLFDNPLPPPLDNDYGVFMLDVILWIVIIVGIYFLLELALKRLSKSTETEFDDIVFGIIRTPILLLLMVYAVIRSLRALEQEWWMEPWIFELLDQVYFIVLFLVILYLTYKLFKKIVIYYGNIFAKKTDTEFDDIIIPVAEKVGAVLIIVVGIAILLSYLGVDLTMLAVGSIVISMVIAFALQDTLSNFFSGIYLLTDRPFKVGDLILLESGEVCRVEDIGMRSTRVYNTFEHTLIVLPNNRLANDKIVNYTEPDTQFRITVPVSVAYGTDPDKVIKILFGVAMANPNILKKLKKYKPSVRFTKFGDSSLNFELVVWIDHVEKRFDVTTVVHKQIDRRFKEEKVEIPFPQRVVWMRDERTEP